MSTTTCTRFTCDRLMATRVAARNHFTRKAMAVGASIAALFAVFFMGAGCSESPTAPSLPESAPAIHGLEITNAPLAMNPGENTRLQVAVRADDGVEELGVTWTSSAPALLRVEPNGKVFAIAPGTVEVTARAKADGTIDDKVRITVTSPEATVTGVAIDPVAENLYVGDRLSLSATVSGTGTFDPSVNWRSSRPHIASIDAQGVVTAEATGSVEITAESKADPTKSTQVQLEVRAPRIVEVVLGVAQPLMSLGETQTLDLEVRHHGQIDTSVSWTMSDAAVATIDEQTRVVTAHHMGVVTIEAASNADPNQRASVTIAVRPADVSITIGRRISLAPSNNPNIYVTNGNFEGNVRPASSDFQKVDATFIVREGLAGVGISFESASMRGHYLRHEGTRMKVAKSEGSAQFKDDATFFAKNLNGDDTVSFESKNNRGNYFRHLNGWLWIDDDIFPNGSHFLVKDGLWAAGRWMAMPGRATDVGAGADGTVCMIGADRIDSQGYGIYKWNATTRSWDVIPTSGVRVAVDPQGNPWVAEADNQLWIYRGSRWYLMGQAIDVGIGAEGSVYIVGDTPNGPGGNAIYKRVGNGWEQILGAAVRISVDPNGNPWVVNAEGKVYRSFDGRSFSQVPGSATDIGIGADGSVWIVQKSNNELAKWNGSEFVASRGTRGTSVAVGPQGQNWHTNSSNQIWAQF